MSPSGRRPRAGRSTKKKPTRSPSRPAAAAPPRSAAPARPKARPAAAGQRRDEAGLRASEERCRALVEQAADGIVVADGDFRILEVNPAFCTMMGYPRDALLQGSACDFFASEDLAARPLTIEPLMGGAALLTCRRLRRRDGTIFVAECSSKRLVDGRILVILRDITEQKRAEEALRESEERFRRVFESEMMGMVFGLRGGPVAKANDYFLRLVGYTRDDLLAGRLRWDAIVPPEFAHLTEEAVRQARVAGTSKPFETEFIRKDGTRVPALCGTTFIGSARGLGGGFVLDLTGLRRTEQRLAESERYLERAQVLAHVGTWDADLATMTATFSDEMLRIFGRPPGGPAVTYSEFIAAIHPDDRPAVEQTIRQAITRPGEQKFEHRLVRPDGTVRIVEATSESVWDASGRPARIIGSAQDITERRFLELQLREAQKLEAIGRLAGGVAHDFNNLLTVILGFTETLLEGLPAGDTRRASAEQIRAAGRRAARLTQQLLAFGRRQVLRTQVFDLNVVLAEMRDILERLIGGEIEIVISPDARPCLVEADRGQLEQVILNLVLNARDAMPAGGRLGIATRRVEPSTGEQRASWLELAVSDTGTGMSPEVQAQIFEPFFTTKEVGQGTGLGLATVHGIVTQTGGHIEVSSALGKGTTFRVFLPCTEQEADPVEAAPAESGSDGVETVLLVEDESAVRALMARVLRRRGYRVIEVADGDEAIEASDRHSGVVHLLVTDLVMPGMNGRELARFLVHVRPGLQGALRVGLQRPEGRAAERPRGEGGLPAEALHPRRPRRRGPAAPGRPGSCPGCGPDPGSGPLRELVPRPQPRAGALLAARPVPAGPGRPLRAMARPSESSCGGQVRALSLARLWILTKAPSCSVWTRSAAASPRRRAVRGAPRRG